MSTMKIKKGDMVKVIAGKDKDKEGKVIAVDKKDGRVLVELINNFACCLSKTNFFVSIHLEAYSCCFSVMK